MTGRRVAEARDDNRRLRQELDQLIVDLLVEEAGSHGPLIRAADVEGVVDHRVDARTSPIRTCLVRTLFDLTGGVSQQWHGFTVERPADEVGDAQGMAQSTDSRVERA